MLSTPDFLDSCYLLWKAGFKYELKPGNRIARGFADIGSEEYSVINQHQAVSLLTGKVIELDEFYLNYYFFVPTVDQCVAEVYQRGFDIKTCEFINQRTWTICLTKDQEVITSESRSLSSCLVDLLKKVMKVK